MVAMASPPSGQRPQHGTTAKHQRGPSFDACDFGTAKTPATHQNTTQDPGTRARDQLAPWMPRTKQQQARAGQWSCRRRRPRQRRRQRRPCRLEDSGSGSAAAGAWRRRRPPLARPRQCRARWQGAPSGTSRTPAGMWEQGRDEEQSRAGRVLAALAHAHAAFPCPCQPGVAGPLATCWSPTGALRWDDSTSTPAHLGIRQPALPVHAEHAVSSAQA